MSQSTYCSYLIRIAHVAPPTHNTTWRIEVKHIQRGEEYRFDCIDSLLLWLREQAASLRTFSNPDVEET
ncbi:MAG: hypothetical protein DCC55_00080 [Chloroflexi bacterium]|nr:MAG: hypothetical protein DCC55_00080 [Chloroflexota bacterium]